MEPIEPIQELLEGVQLNEPSGGSRLLVYPLFTQGPRSFEYLTFAQAMEEGLLTVTEVDEMGNVPELLAPSKASLPVLLLEGELLLGLKQTRVLNVTILLPPGTTTRIPVSCVEAGRWHTATAAVRPERQHLSPRVRQVKTRWVAAASRAAGAFYSDQAAVWDGVADRLHRVALHSPTSSFAEIEGARQEDIESLVRSLEQAPDQTGLVAVIGGRPVCLDLFDRPDTLAAVWEPLLRSYAIDALTEPSQTRQVSARTVKAWLKRMAAAETSAHPGVGLGDTVNLTAAGLVGSALVYEGSVVHLAAQSAGAMHTRFVSPTVRGRG